MKKHIFLIILAILLIFVSCAGSPPGNPTGSTNSLINSPNSTALDDWSEFEATIITVNQQMSSLDLDVPAWVSAFQWSAFTWEPEGMIFRLSNDSKFRLVRKLEKKPWTFEGQNFYIQNLLFKAPKDLVQAEGTLKVLFKDLNTGETTLLPHDMALAGLRTLGRPTGWIRIVKITATDEGLAVEMEYR